MPGGTRRLVTSRSNDRLLVATREFLKSCEECVLISPSRSAGEEVVYEAGGRAGVHRLTLHQIAADLARSKMAELGLVPLTALGLEALAARVVHEASRELKYFKPVAELAGFSRALARTLKELRLAQVDRDRLARSGAPGADLAVLLERFEQELTDRALADLARVLEIASGTATGGEHRWLGLPIVVLDAPLDTLAHREFFRAIAGRAPRLLIALGPGQEFGDFKFDAPIEDLDRDIDASRGIEHLRRYLFSDDSEPPQEGEPGFEIFSSPGEGLEAVEIARRILRFASDGVAFDRVSILVRSPERYQPMIEDALRRANIPAYFSRGSARPDPGGRAFLALLECKIDGLSASRFSEYLSLGQVPAVPDRGKDWVAADDDLLPSADAGEPEEREESGAARTPSAWERLLVDAAVIGGRDRWQRRLRGLEHEFELRLTLIKRDDDGRRASVERKLRQLRDFENFALPLIDILDALPSRAVWRDWIESLGGLARAALRTPDPVLALLSEFAPMGDVGPVSLEEVAEVLSERLRFLRRDPPERRHGRVMVASIDEARGRSFDVVFLPGLAEGIFPQRALEDPLLLDRFRAEISSSLKSRDGKVDDERARLLVAAAAAEHRLIASYPRMDVAESRPRVPSFYALELPRAAFGKLPELKSFEREARDAAPARLNWPAPPTVDAAIDDLEYDLVALKDGRSAKARYLVEANERLGRSLRSRWRRWESRWREPDGLITHHADALAALQKHRLMERVWSPSALQQFAACPYRFALHGIYGLRPREDASPLEQMDPLTRGALFHAAQFAVLNELRTGERLPVRSEILAEVLEIADAVLDRVAGKYQEELAPAIERVWRTEVEDLRTDLRGWLQHVAVNDDEWKPIHFEFAFGLAASNDDHDPASRSEDATLADAGVRLRGSIDLVERNARTGVLRVTDHKTGKAPEQPPLYVGGGKFLQPLLYGLAAQELLGQTVESGRLFFATQRGSYQYTPINITPPSRLVLKRLLANIDGAIAAGFLPPVPQKDACKSCDYRAVCGPYEERRAMVYKERRDDRIDPLTEIRAMV